MSNAFNELRYEVLVRAIKYGTTFSHRLEEIRFDDANTVLLPDMKTEPDFGFSTEEAVTVNRCRLLPWHDLLPHEVDRHGMDTEWYYNHIFQILCFARVTAAKRKCRIEGLFCALADYGNGYPIPNGPALLRSDSKIRLHWVGALVRPPKPITLPT